MRELYSRLPENVKAHLDTLRKAYSVGYPVKGEVIIKISEYAQGLRDAGLVSEYERSMLCVYCFN